MINFMERIIRSSADLLGVEIPPAAVQEAAQENVGQVTQQVTQAQPASSWRDILIGMASSLGKSPLTRPEGVEGDSSVPFGPLTEQAMAALANSTLPETASETLSGALENVRNGTLSQQFGEMLSSATGVVQENATAIATGIGGVGTAGLLVWGAKKAMGTRKDAENQISNQVLWDAIKDNREAVQCVHNMKPFMLEKLNELSADQTRKLVAVEGSLSLLAKLKDLASAKDKKAFDVKLLVHTLEVKMPEVKKAKEPSKVEDESGFEEDTGNPSGDQPKAVSSDEMLSLINTSSLSGLEMKEKKKIAEQWADVVWPWVRKYSDRGEYALFQLGIPEERAAFELVSKHKETFLPKMYAAYKKINVAEYVSVVKAIIEHPEFKVLHEVQLAAEEAAQAKKAPRP